MREGPGRIVVRVAGAVDQRQVAGGNVRLPREPAGHCEKHVAGTGEAGAECVDQQLVRQAAAHRRLEAQHALRGAGEPVVDALGVERQALREIPLGPVNAGNSRAREHLRKALDRSQRASAVPAEGGPAGGGHPRAEVSLGRDQARRRGRDVERIAVLREVGDRDLRGEVKRGQQPRRLPQRRLVWRPERGQRPGRAEDSRVGGRNAAEVQPRGRGRGVEARQGRSGGGGALGTERAAVDVDQAGQLVGAGMSAEVPRGIRGHHVASERMAAEHDLAAALAGRRDHVMEISDGDLHAPLLGELDARIWDRNEVLGDALVDRVPEVVVEHLRGTGLAPLGQVEHRLILEQVLPTFHTPHLPPLLLGHDPPRERDEVRRPSRRAGFEHQHVPGPRGADLEHPDLVVTGRGPRRRRALHPIDVHGRRRGRAEHERQCGDGGEQQLWGVTHGA